MTGDDMLAALSTRSVLKVVSAENGPSFVRAGEIAAQPDVSIDYLVEGMIPCGGTALIAAKPKAGKTTLAFSLALAVARGEPFLGRATRQGAVLYGAFEGAEHQLRSRLRAMGVRPNEDLLVCIGRAPKDAVPWLREAAEEHQPVLIIVDTLQRFAQLKDLNDYAAVSLATDPLIELARMSGAALVYVHHAGKAERTDAGDSVLGSTALLGSVDTAVIVKRTERHRTLSTIQRFGDELAETVLTMDPETFLVNSAGTKYDADVGDAKERIISYLGEQQEPVTELAIREAVEVRRKVLLDALRTLLANGGLSRLGGGKKGDPYRYSVPAENSSSGVPDICSEPENQNLQSVAEHARAVLG